jgi:uncharacterized protein YkwD
MDGGRTGRYGVGIAALLLSTILIVGLAPSRLDAEASESSGTVPASIRLRPDLRDDVLALTNADREKHEREALAVADRLARYAARHSRRMAELGYLFHSGNEQLRTALGGDDWAVAGENVGVGSTLAGVQNAFMASPAHRENILGDSFNHAAVGVAESGGVVWVTVIFFGD